MKFYQNCDQWTILKTAWWNLHLYCQHSFCRFSLISRRFLKDLLRSYYFKTNIFQKWLPAYCLAGQVWLARQGPLSTAGRTGGGPAPGSPSSPPCAPPRSCLSRPQPGDENKHYNLNIGNHYNMYKNQQHNCITYNNIISLFWCF